MVSEGVDIPRLRVGVYLTNIKAELFFRQAIGRFVRVLSELQWQDAFIFIPADKDLIKLAEQIQEEREHALDDAKKNGTNSDNFEIDLFGNEYTPALSGRFEMLGSIATDISIIEINVGISNGMRDSIDNRKLTEDNAPIFLKKKYLREHANKLARIIAIKRDKRKPDFRFAHNLWIETGGQKISNETIEDLEKRIKFFKNVLEHL